MKRLRVTKKKIILLSITLALVAGSAFAYAYVSGPSRDIKATVSTKKADPKPVEEDTPQTPVSDTPTEPTNTDPIDPVAEPTAPEPEPVLSTQAYAEKYLDLSGANQKCFDAFVATWPERFIESNREHDVKALKVYASVCSSGILDKGQGNIWIWGKHGEFFDSEAAHKQW
jgi:hypothetical protein